MKQNNLKALHRHSPATLFFLKRDIEKEKIELELLDTTSGHNTIRMTIEGRQVLLHSKREPLKEAQRFVEKINVDDGNFIVVYGMGLGFHVKEIFSNIISKRPETKLLVIEPSFKVFEKAMSLYDFADEISNDRVEFAVGMDEEDVREKLSKLFKMYENDAIKVFEFNVYRRLFPEYFERVDDTMKNALSVGISNYTTVINYIDEWHSNILKNLKHIIKSPGVTDYQGKFSGKPAIVISAGPSLDKNGFLLKKIKGKALLIAVDTAVKPLLSMGIEPDIVISVDSQYANFKHLEGVELPNAYCMCSPIVYPDVCDIFEGRIIFFNFYFQLSVWIEQYLKPNGILFTGGSVATVAFDFARKIGADPIVFVGQDLAFTGDYHHCVETYSDKLFFNDLSKDRTLLQEHRQNIIDSDKTKIKEKDIFGRDVISYRVLRDYCKWLEYECGKTEGTMINATEGGILKENVKLMRLKDVIDEYLEEDVNIEKIFEDNFNLLPKKKIYDFSKILGKVNENISFMKKRSLEISEIVKKMHKLYTENNKGKEYNKLAIKVEKTGIEMEKRLSIGTFLVEKFQTEYWPLLRTLKKNPEFMKMDDDLQKLEQLNIKYEILNKICDDMQESFIEAEKNVKEYLKTV